MTHIHATTYYLAGRKEALTVNPQVFDPDSSAPLKDREDWLPGENYFKSEEKLLWSHKQEKSHSKAINKPFC